MKNNFSNVKQISDLKTLKNLLKNKKFSLVHGVFDVIHIGHKRHFDTAKKLTGTLLVSITSDRFVKKGPDRPFFNESLRCEMVSSLDSVTYVYLNDKETPIEIIKNVILEKVAIVLSVAKNENNTEIVVIATRAIHGTFVLFLK